MTLLSQYNALRIISDDEFDAIGMTIERNDLAIRQQEGTTYGGGAGYNLGTGSYRNSIAYATALYASICFSQDACREQDITRYYVLLLTNCARSGSDTYTYTQGSDRYTTLRKCGALGADATVAASWPLNDSAIALSRRIVENILVYMPIRAS